MLLGLLGMLKSSQINKRTRANLESETVCTRDCTMNALKSRNWSCVWAKNKSELNVLVFTSVFHFYFFFFSEMVEPGQDLLLAALSESGISPNDLFDIDSPDVVLANPAPTPAVQQVKTRA